MLGVDVGSRVIELRWIYFFGKNQLYKTVNVLGYAIRTEFFQQRNIIACRASTRRL